MKCPYCKKEARWCENGERYGRNYGKSYMCYWCKDCDSYVGYHNNTKQPLGTMANYELRELRKEAHRLFDPLWKSGTMTRKSAYKYLEEKTGVKHIGESREIDCIKVITFLTQQP